MKEGKLPSALLKSLVFDQIRVKNEAVILRPEIGEDCAAIDFGEYACVLSTDPITGASAGAGALAVHISCNDIASAGVKPLALMITIMAPTTASEEDIGRIMKEAGDAAAALGVEIIGGHTEVTSAVNKIIISTTALGKVVKDKLIKTSGAKVGDDLVMTKWAGLEGTAILSADREAELAGKLSRAELDEAKAFIEHISVVKEGVLAGAFGANSMHDVTEGGIFGAAWEIAESSGTGVALFIDEIPVHPVTRKICGIYGIDPYKLISSGCMLIACRNGAGLVSRLSEEGIPAAVIGSITEKDRYMIGTEGRQELPPPEADELFKINAS